MSSEAFNSDDVENEIKESLVRRIKDRGSQIGLKKKIEQVNEDFDGEISKETSNKISLNKKIKQPDSESEPDIARNTLERMILDNVGIDLSTQQTFEDIPQSQNGLSKKLSQQRNDNPINIKDLKKQHLDSSKEMNMNKRDETEEIEMYPSSNIEEANEIVLVKDSDALTPEFQSLINSINAKKVDVEHEIYAEFDLKKSRELMSSKDYITKENSGPREMDLDSVDKNEDMDYAKEYFLYEGKVEDIYGRYKLKKRVDNQENEENGQNEVNPEKEESKILMKNNKTISKKELNNIIENKIQEIIDDEIQYRQ